MQTTNDMQVILKKLRVWRLVALFQTLFLLVIIGVNRYQYNQFREQVRFIILSENKKNDTYQKVIKTMQKAFDMKYPDGNLNAESSQ